MATVKGININAISKLTNALDDYKKAIKYPYVGVNAETIAKHLKGSKSKAEIVAYSQQLDKEVSEFVKLLDSLNTSLSQVKAAYAKQDGENANAIKAHTTKLKS